MYIREVHLGAVHPMHRVRLGI